MAPESNPVRAVAREFAASVGEGDPADAADLLSETGTEEAVESFPEEFQQGELDAEAALREYHRGLYGQYGDFEGVETVAAEADCAIVELGFEDGAQTLELGVEDGSVADLCFPTSYAPPLYADCNAFAERDVTVDADDATLNGNLAVPEGDGPFPGVVLVHGAGIHDPDGTVGATKILRDFAWGLATDGVAVLRYEKRLRDHDVPDEAFTLDNVVVDDAVAAVDELAAADAVAEDALFVAGHSQGGMAAPRVAERHGNVAGVVNLDGPADPVFDPEDVDILKYEFEPDGDLDEEQAAQLEAQKEAARRIAAGDYEVDETLWSRPGAWHDSVADYDPREALRRADCPVFAAKPYRVDEDRQPELAEWARQGYEAWRDADLPSGSRTERYEGLGHYFQEGYAPSSMLSLYFGGNAAEFVVHDVAEWVETIADA